LVRSLGATQPPQTDGAVAVLGAAADSRAPRPFLVGSENALVRKVIQAIGSPNGATPLVITGVRGTGKSHVLELVVAEFRRRFEGAATLAATAVDFARAYADAVETDSIGEFRRRFGRAQLLAIDDLHRLADKPAAQHELLHLMDAHLRRGCLLALTLPVHPLEADELSEGLRSRLSGGLVVPLAIPERATRRALVEHYAAQQGVRVTPEAAEALADVPHLRLAGQLRHAVLTLTHDLAVAGGPSMENEAVEITLPLVEEFLGSEPAAAASLKTIVAAASKRLHVTVADLRGKSRRQSVAGARSLAMYLARELGRASYAEIGRYFHRDHSTVMYACKKTAANVACQPHLRQLVDQFASELAVEAAP
jgi:chromosomal replication initiator protein